MYSWATARGFALPLPFDLWLAGFLPGNRTGCSAWPVKDALHLAEELAGVARQ